MVLVDVIDWTCSSPPASSDLIVIEDDEEPAKMASTSKGTGEKETKKRKKGRNDDWTRDGQRNYEDNSRDGVWKHDRFFDDDRNRGGEKRKWENDADDDSKHPRGRKLHSRPQLFTVDTTPGDVLGAQFLLQDGVDAAASLSGPVDSLLLPVHVTLSTPDSEPISNDDPPLSPISEASGIDFLDDDRAVGAPRYFDDRATNPKAHSRVQCKRCGDDGHDAKNCSNMICFTCGARNEHNPRSCPVLRFCWDCKGKGHIARDCPRIGNRKSQSLDRQDCERCGSWKHHETNCPTIWRIYTYLTDGERDTVLTDRESKRQLEFGAGGEGYIARDQWCYNCGGSGHLGDDCEVAAPNPDRPNEYSAFGSHNFFTGPFASPTSVIPEIQRPPREWEQGHRFDDGSGFAAEDNVGRKGRENAKAKAREAQRVLEEDDDEPDWFNKNRTGAANGKGKANMPSKTKAAGSPPKAPRNIHFGFRNPGSSRPWDSRAPPRHPEPPKPSGRSLRDRIDMDDVRSSRGPRWDHEEKRGKDWRRPGGEVRDRSGRDGGAVDWTTRVARDWGKPGDTDPSRGLDKSGREGGSRWRGGYGR